MAETRKGCCFCGAVKTESTTADMIDAYPALVDGFEFAPTVHIDYASRVIDLPDGLPKFRDRPEAVGGTGQMFEED